MIEIFQILGQMCRIFRDRFQRQPVPSFHSLPYLISLLILLRSQPCATSTINRFASLSSSSRLDSVDLHVDVAPQHRPYPVNPRLSMRGREKAQKQETARVALFASPLTFYLLPLILLHQAEMQLKYTHTYTDRKTETDTGSGGF